MSRSPSPTLSALALAVALGGCTAGPEFQRPTPPQSAHYTATPFTQAGGDGVPSQTLASDATPQRAWWRQFHSPALDGVVQRALAHNADLAAARANLAAADERVAAESGRRLPQVDLSAGIGRDKYGAQFLGDSPKPAPFTYFSLGPGVSYTLDYTGGSARAIEQKRALASVQRAQLAAAALTVSAKAVEQSLQIASLRAQIATVQTLLSQDRENLKLVREAFAAGAVSRLDVVSANSQLASDAVLLPPLRQRLSVARHALAVVAGTPPGDAALAETTLAGLTLPARLPVGVPSELAHRRPDILAAEAQLHAATAAVGVATARLYPRITLTAAFSQESTDAAKLFDPSNDAWSLASGLVAPLFDGGTLRAEKRATVDTMHARAEQYRQTVLTAFGQVADALAALRNDGEAEAAHDTALKAARENLDLTRKSYRAGNVGILQVLDAERRYQQASLGDVRVRAQRYLDSARLYLALGGNGPANDNN